jgi:uncharacterized protein YdhG (YjbR/CyaY superfamily)
MTMAKTTKAAGLSDQEKEAMRTRMKELAAEEKQSRKREDGEKAVKKVIDGLSGTDKAFAAKVHELVAKNAPELWPKTWYGFPAYARAGQVVCFFKPAGRFGVRYAELGFNEFAKLDEGSMWPTVYALVALGPDEEDRIAALLRKAVS